jgi:RNA polymerase sigma-70 factor (ECF subfamily)
MRAKAAKSDTPHTKTPQPGEAESQDRLSAALAGEADALEAILAETRPRLYALALRVLGDPADAEDAVQDAMVKVWRNLPRFEGRSSFGTWIHRIAINAALDRRRRRSTTPSGDVDVDVVETRPSDERPPVETPERAYARAEAGAVVHRALGRLSLVHSEAIRMFEIEGDSYAEIATATRCPIGTVMSRLYHARRKLVREVTSSAAGEGDLQALRAA